MASLDAATLAQQVTKLGLVTHAQLEECLQELGETTGDGEPLLRLLERKGYLTLLQIDKLRKGDVTGYFLGGYRLLYKIASGSFGRVYRADDPTTGRVVALKVLRHRWSERPESVVLFEREGRVGMGLRHPNIVEILAVGRDANTKQYYIVMEFVEGGNLRDLLIIRQKFEPAEALRLLEDVASALAYAYARGVTHRDIKLTNILISSQGVAKLVDFGLAQLYSAARRGLIDENDIHVQRTVDYAGLEKATNVPPGDTRSDIFFLGCVAYEMLTGRPPLPLTRDKYARMRKERFMEIPPIRPDEVNGPPSVIRLVETMMALDPAQRFQTPAQLLEAIRHVRAELAGTSNGQLLAVPVAAPAVFVIERDERLQDALRKKLKELGYRVLIAGDPSRAVERFAQQPFPGLVVDVGTTGEDGVRGCKRILHQARDRAFPCHSILILNEDQSEYATMFNADDPVTILTRPLKLGQLLRTLRKRVPLPQ
jgi:serine/threonine protein kinase